MEHQDLLSSLSRRDAATAGSDYLMGGARLAGGPDSQACWPAFDPLAHVTVTFGSCPSLRFDTLCSAIRSQNDGRAR